jgi:hypothetical protein
MTKNEKYFDWKAYQKKVTSETETQQKDNIKMSTEDWIVN